MSSVVVLTPAGRRQKVLVTPNTSILQILEDVCTKQGFSPFEYDLRHHKTVLDTSSTVRFSNLPNNAQLELVKTTRVKVESTVTIGLQLPSNERAMTTFDTQASLWDVLVTVQKERNEILTQSQDDEGNVLEPVCVYMRREVVGEQQLQATTLRSLGLTGGKAIVRLSYRVANQVVVQAHVESIVFPPPKESPKLSSPEECWDTPSSSQQHYFDEGASTSASQTYGRRYESGSDGNDDFQAAGSGYRMDTPKSEPPAAASNDNFQAAGAGHRMDTPKSESPAAALNVPVAYAKSVAAAAAAELEEPMHESPLDEIDETNEKLIYLDDKGSLLYCLNDVDAPVNVELPESYFEATVSDVKLLFSDLKRVREELEDGVMRTQEMRESECLLRLNQYPKAVVRVVFPDRLVLQGHFRAISPAEEIFQFVRTFLADDQCKFHLFTTPPRKLLNPVDRLFEIPLVPAAIVYFGCGCEPKQEKYLKDSVLQQISSPRAVNRDTSKLRVSTKSKNDNVGFALPPSQTNTSSTASSSSSLSSRPSSAFTGSNQGSSPPAPKWFSSGKK